MDWPVFVITIFLSLAITAAIRSVRLVFRMATEALTRTATRYEADRDISRRAGGKRTVTHIRCWSKLTRKLPAALYCKSSTPTLFSKVK
jgi:hypothetical protein